jgi:hypothetical protein
VSRGSGPLAVGTVAAYAAAIVAFGYALVSLYWAVGGRGLAGTVGGYVQQMARRGGGAVVLLAVVAVAAKAVAGLIALALARPWGRVVRRSWLLVVSAAASVLLIGYGGLSVATGALVLSGVVHPSGSVDRIALRWHGTCGSWCGGSCWRWQPSAPGGRTPAAAPGDCPGHRIHIRAERETTLNCRTWRFRPRGISPAAAGPCAHNRHQVSSDGDPDPANPR